MYTHKETNKLYALLRFIVIYMPKNEVRIYNSKAVIYQNDYDVWQFRILLADEDWNAPSEVVHQLGYDYPVLGGLNDGWKTRKAGRYRAEASAG